MTESEMLPLDGTELALGELQMKIDAAIRDGYARAEREIRPAEADKAHVSGGDE